MKRMRPTNPANPTGENPLPRLNKPRSGRGADFAQKYGRAPTEKELQYGRALKSERLPTPPLNKSRLGTAENPNNRGLVPTGRFNKGGSPQISGSIGLTEGAAPVAAPPVPRYDDPTGSVLGYKTGTTSALGGGMGMNEDQYSVRRLLLGA